MNESTTVIPHEHLYFKILIRQVVDEPFFDIKLDIQHLEIDIFPIVDRPADPTDRPFDPSSSPDDGCSVENRHDTASLGNKHAEKGIEVRF
ncbi:hypothetical protein ACFL6B_00945 [Thermodesulfobacteriota bacterium]